MRGHPALLLAVVGLSASGATCKGGDAQPHNDPKPPPPQAEPLVRAPAITEMEGVDLTSVPPTERMNALRLLNENYAYCGCARTVAACLANRADCSCVKSSDRMAQFVVNSYQQGASTEDVEDMLLGGFAQGYNAPPLSFSLEGQAVKGSEEAPITIVEFADFMCSHCAAANPVLDRVAKKHPDVKVVYFYFPLSGNGEPAILAAEAAEEARIQGKFWPMANALFNLGYGLDRESIAKTAIQVGLDMTKFAAAMDARKHKAKVMDNKRIGEAAKIMSTPAIFVNGRPFGLARTVDAFDMRIEMEKERGQCN